MPRRRIFDSEPPTQPDRSSENCPACLGEASFLDIIETGVGHSSVRRKCFACRGTGRIAREELGRWLHLLRD